jgi:hypothetical protein
MFSFPLVTFTEANKFSEMTRDGKNNIFFVHCLNLAAFMEAFNMDEENVKQM